MNIKKPDGLISGQVYMMMNSNLKSAEIKL